MSLGRPAQVRRGESAWLSILGQHIRKPIRFMVKSAQGIRGVGQLRLLRRTQAREDAETKQGSVGSTVQAGSAKHRTRREVSDRQRFRILVRDGFRCRACGASPLTQAGVELHVDHVLPWSKGGETTDDNLLTMQAVQFGQGKCVRCLTMLRNDDPGLP